MAAFLVITEIIYAYKQTGSDYGSSGDYRYINAPS